MIKKVFTPILIAELVILSALLFLLKDIKTDSGHWFGGKAKTAQEFHELSRFLFEQGKYKEAESAARKALDLDAKFAKAHIDLGCAYYGMGSYVRAEFCFKKALDYLENDKINEVITYCNLCAVYEKEKKTEDAWFYCRKAYLMKSSFSPSDFWRDDPVFAVYHVIHNNKDRFVNAVKSDDGFPPELYKFTSRMKIYFALGFNKTVISQCSRYLADNPGSYYSYYFNEWIAHVLSRQGKFFEAIEVLKNIENSPKPKEDDLWVKYYLAYNYYRLKNYATALSYLHLIAKGISQDIFAKNKSSETLTLIQKVLFDAKGKIQDAFITDKSLPIDYKMWLNQILTGIYMKQKDYDLALRFIDENIKNATSKKSLMLDALFYKADIYKEKEQIQKQKEVLKDIIAKFPRGLRTISAHYELSLIYEAEGDYLNAYFELAKSAAFNFILLSNVIFSFLLSGLLCGLLTAVYYLFYKKKKEETDSFGQRYNFRIGDLFIFFLLWFIIPWTMQVISLCLNWNFPKLFSSIDINPYVLTIFISDFFLVILCLAFLKAKYKIDNITLGFYSRGYKYNIILPLLVSLGMIVSSIAVFFVVVELLKVKIPDTPLEMMVDNIFKVGRPMQIIYLFAASSIMTGLAEELIYRVFLINFIKNFTSLSIAVIFSSLLFVFAHQNIILAPYYLVIGLIFSLMYIKTKTIIPSMVTHGLFNLVLLVFSLLSYSK